MPPKKPAFDFKTSVKTPSGYDFRVSLKITDKLTAVGAIVGGMACGAAAVVYGVVYLIQANPDLVKAAVKAALEAVGVEVKNVTPGSILVEVLCTSKESFLLFMDAFETNKIKQRLEEEFQKKLNFKGELEVKITNEQEVYEHLDQLRRFEKKHAVEEVEGHISVKTGVDLSGSPITGEVAITEEISRESQIKEEFVHVPKHLKGYVIGIGGRVVKKIQQASGAKVVAKPRDEEGFTVTGNEEQRECAKNLISQKLTGARMTYKESQFNKGCYYIDGWNVAEDSKLKLEQIAKEDGIILPESLAQYRIKAAKADDAQKSCCPNDDPTYMSKLKDHTLESLRQMKREMEAKSLKADMWCHFGKVIIRRPIEDEDAEREYTIEEATSKFQENRWKASFQVGVHLNDNILQDHLHAFEKTPAEYKEFSSRYDLTFLMPNGRQIFLRVRSKITTFINLSPCGLCPNIGI